jgi:hypothetical protein
MRREVGMASSFSPYELGAAFAVTPEAAAANWTLLCTLMTELSAKLSVLVVVPSADSNAAVAVSTLNSMAALAAALVGNLSLAVGVNATSFIVEPSAAFINEDGVAVVLDGGDIVHQLELSSAGERAGTPWNNPSPELVATVTSSVSTVVSVGIGLSVASAVVGAVTSAAVGASASSGASANGALPLVFGAQRLSVSSSLALNKSALQTGVANGLSWTTGQLGIAGAASQSRRHRQLQTTSSKESQTTSSMEPSAADELLDALISAGLVAAAVLAFHAAVLHLWARYINARYYREAMGSRIS